MRYIGTLSFAAGLAFGLLAFPSAPAQAGDLDGKVYVGEAGEKGKAANEKDEITFADGQFHSKGCDPYGFGKGAYKAKAKDGTISFEATTTSVKEGKIQWTGTIKGDALDGHYVWTKAGQAPIEYWVKATLTRK